VADPNSQSPPSEEAGVPGRGGAQAPSDQRYDFGPDNRDYQIREPDFQSGSKIPGPQELDFYEEFRQAQIKAAAEGREIDPATVAQFIPPSGVEYPGRESPYNVPGPGKPDYVDFYLGGQGNGLSGAALLQHRWNLVRGDVSEAVVTGANMLTMAENYKRTLLEERTGIRKDPDTGDWYWGRAPEDARSYEFPFQDSLRVFGEDLKEPIGLIDSDVTRQRGGGPDFQKRAGIYVAPTDVYDIARRDFFLFDKQDFNKDVNLYWDDILADMIDGGFSLEDEEGYLANLSDREVEMYYIIKEGFLGQEVSGSTPADPILGSWYGGYGDPYLNYGGFPGFGGGGGGGGYDQFIMSPALTRWNYS